MAERTVPCAKCGKGVRSEKTPEPVCHACRKAARIKTCAYCKKEFDCGRHFGKECCNKWHAQALGAWRQKGWSDSVLLRLIEEVAPEMINRPC